MIPLIVAGKPDDRELECFPPPLKFKLDAKGRITKKRVEVLAADAREEGDGKDLALAKVIAGLLGLSSDDVFRRAERERRAAARRRGGCRRWSVHSASCSSLPVWAGGSKTISRSSITGARTMLPAVLTADEERDAEAEEEFTECKNGCPAMVVVPARQFHDGLVRTGQPSQQASAARGDDRQIHLPPANTR